MVQGGIVPLRVSSLSLGDQVLPGEVSKGVRKKNFLANTDNSKLFDLVKIVFGASSLWAHAKIFSRDRDGRAPGESTRYLSLGFLPMVC